MPKGTTTSSGARKPPPGSVPTDSRGGTELPSNNAPPPQTAKSSEPEGAPAASNVTPMPMPPGHDSPMMNKEVKAAIAVAFEKRSNLEDKRRAINADIKAINESLVARGLNKHAINEVYRYWQMDEPKREGMDESRTVLRAGAGLPIAQAEMFPKTTPANGNNPVH